MGDWRIHEQRPERHKDQERSELGPFGEGTRDQGGRNDRERHLEDHEENVRDRIGVGPWFLAYILHSEEVGRIPDEAAEPVRSERQ